MNRCIQCLCRFWSKPFYLSHLSILMFLPTLPWTLCCPVSHPYPCHTFTVASKALQAIEYKFTYIHICLYIFSFSKENFKEINGWLGWRGHRLGPFCGVFTWIIVPASWQRKASGFLQFSNKWPLHICSFPSLLWLYGYLPHCHWRAHW